MSLSSFFASLIDRLRAWRSPTARSAIERQEAYLEGHHVEERRWETLETPEGPVSARVATIAQPQETVEPLPETMMTEVRDGAAFALRFVHDHVASFNAPNWSLQDLDDAFAGWQAHGDKENCPPHVAGHIVGSAFGEYCVRTLGMRWVLLTDAAGSEAMVEGQGKDESVAQLRLPPFAVVHKRIEAGESGFLVAIYRLLQDRMK